MILLSRNVFPFCIWTHMPDCDRNAKKMADSTYNWAKEFKLDIIKLMPNGMYMLEDYFDVCFSKVPIGGTAKINNKIHSGSSKSIYKISKQISTRNTGKAINREIKTLNLVRNKVGVKKIILFTSFMPSTLLLKMFLEPLLLNKNITLIQDSELIENLTNYVIRVNSMALDNGANGIFLANQCLPSSILEKEYYNKYIKNHDQKVLWALNKFPNGFHILHFHGAWKYYDIYDLDSISGVSFHMNESEVRIKNVINDLHKILFGGLPRKLIKNGKLTHIINAINKAQDITDDIIFSPNCGLRLPYKKNTIKGIIKYIKKIKCRNCSGH